MSAGACGRAWWAHQVEGRAAEAEDDVLHDDGLAVGRDLVLPRRLARDVDRHGEAVVVVAVAVVVGVLHAAHVHGDGEGDEALAVLSEARLLHWDIAYDEGLVALVRDVVIVIAQGREEQVLKDLDGVFGEMIRSVRRSAMRPMRFRREISFAIPLSRMPASIE